MLFSDHSKHRHRHWKSERAHFFEQPLSRHHTRADGRPTPARDSCQRNHELALCLQRHREGHMGTTVNKDGKKINVEVAKSKTPNQGRRGQTAAHGTEKADKSTHCNRLEVCWGGRCEPFSVCGLRAKPSKNRKSFMIQLCYSWSTKSHSFTDIKTEAQTQVHMGAYLVNSGEKSHQITHSCI